MTPQLLCQNEWNISQKTSRAGKVCEKIVVGRLAYCQVLRVSSFSSSSSSSSSSSACQMEIHVNSRWQQKAFLKNSTATIACSALPIQISKDQHHWKSMYKPHTTRKVWNIPDRFWVLPFAVCKSDRQQKWCVSRCCWSDSKCKLPVCLVMYCNFSVQHCKPKSNSQDGFIF